MYNFYLTCCSSDTSLVNLALILSSFAFILSIVFHFRKPVSRTLILTERDPEPEEEVEEESEPAEEEDEEPEEEVEEEYEPEEESFV